MGGCSISSSVYGSSLLWPLHRSSCSILRAFRASLLHATKTGEQGPRPKTSRDKFDRYHDTHNKRGNPIPIYPAHYATYLLRYPCSTPVTLVVSMFFSSIPILPQYTIVVSMFFSIIHSCLFERPPPVEKALKSAAGWPALNVNSYYF